MKGYQKFAKYNAIAMFVGVMMFFSFDYLKKKEIFAVLIGSLMFSTLYYLLTKSKDKKNDNNKN